MGAILSSYGWSEKPGQAMPTDGWGLRFGQSLGITNRQILAAAIAVMDDAPGSRARPQRLLQCIQNQFSVHRARYAASR